MIQDCLLTYTFGFFPPFVAEPLRIRATDFIRKPDALLASQPTASNRWREHHL